MAFASFASRLLTQSTAQSSSDLPLFYSAQAYEISIAQDDDILGASAEDCSFDHRVKDEISEGRRLSLGEADGQQQQRHISSSKFWEVPQSRSNNMLEAIYTTGIREGIRGWKAHQTTILTPSEVYRDEEFSDTEYDDQPPSFVAVSRALSNSPTIPLLHSRGPHVYPMPCERPSSNGYYMNSNWIAAYGICLLGVTFLGFRTYWNGSGYNGRSPDIPSLFPAVPVLATLAFLSLAVGAIISLHLVAIRNASRHLVWLALFGGPSALFVAGMLAVANSYGNDGVESDPGWRAGIRWFGLLCILLSIILAKIAIDRRKEMNRTIKLLELAATILIEHPPLVIFCLALSLLSTAFTLPYLLLLVSREDFSRSASFSIITWTKIATLAIYVWTQAIVRGLLKATITGVAGAWFFERHSPTRRNAVEITKAAFARARGRSLGTIIAASFCLAGLKSLRFVVHHIRKALLSSKVPIILRPLALAAPVLDILLASLEMFNDYVLTYAALSGSDFSTSASELVHLLSTNGTKRVGEALLIRVVLGWISLIWGLVAGLIAFLFVSKRMQDVQLAPMAAILCLVIPWTIKLCVDIVGDTADAVFLSWNFDLKKATTHCLRAGEIFADPDLEN